MNPEPLKLLIVEDEPMILRLLSKFLADSQREVVLAKNGMEALELLKQHRFDAVLSDVLMPELTGIELLEKIRQQNKNIPFCFLSAYQGGDHHTAAAKLGAFAFLNKPFRKQDLGPVVTEALLFGRSTWKDPLEGV